MKIMIDPGHCVGNANKGKMGYYEYLGVWIISIILQSILRALGFQAELTRKWDDDPDFKVRGIQAQGCDLFISEHSNANDTKTRGVEVFYDFEKPYDKVNAEKLSRAVSSVMGNPDRGAKTRTYVENGKELNYYGIIRNAAKTDCKHILLIESGFHDNLADEEFLLEYDNLKKIALAQALVICEILNVKIDYKEILQNITGIDDNTINYIDFYRYADPLKEKLVKSVL